MSEHDVNSQRGDDLVDRLLAGDDVSHDLLKEIWAGYPASNLYRLVKSGQQEAEKAAAWIASELGYRSTEMMSEVGLLLTNPLRYVKYYALEAVLTGATVENGAIVGRAVALIDNPDNVVRWKVVELLSRSANAILAAAQSHVDDVQIRHLLAWLIGIRATPHDVEDVVASLSHADAQVRMFAVAAAARLAYDNRVPLQEAATSEYDDVKTFAQKELDFVDSWRTAPSWTRRLSSHVLE